MQCFPSLERYKIFTLFYVTRDSTNVNRSKWIGWVLKLGSQSHSYFILAVLTGSRKPEAA